MIKTRGFTLADWQAAAVQAWASGDAAAPHRGTLEIVTGGGKTLIAMACAERAAEQNPDLRIAVVVPTEALARQWQTALERFTSLEASEIGLLGAGESANFSTRRAIVAVLNTASRQLPALAKVAQPLMLIVDECHRAGAPTFSRVLNTPANYRLGLSATPDREEFDEAGQPLRYDEQLVGRALGPVVYRFTLRDARLAGWLPDYNIHHHGVQLSDDERRQYDQISRQVDDLAEELQSLGFETSRSQQLQKRRDDVGQIARRYIAATSRRKDLLYRAANRSRVAHRILDRTLGSGQARRVLLFHERVNEAISLYRDLVKEMPDTRIAIEHSRLNTRSRTLALENFRTGAAQVLVSVKSLVEGIDVPEADVGLSVASTSSVRQRIQALGRVLRRRFDDTGAPKHADMHLIYVSGTVDEQIYAKEDWADLTGEGANHYLRWPSEPDAEPEEMLGPPATPRPTEEQEWNRIGRAAPTEPLPWLGVVAGQEYSVDTLGNVTTISGVLVGNPQDVAAMVERVRKRPGGRFRVTPLHRLVLVWGEGPDGTTCYAAGQLREPFKAEVALTDTIEDAPCDPTDLKPGTLLSGPVDKLGGSYRLRQKQGGVIERRTDDGIEFALLDSAASADLTRNARLVLDNWRQLFDRGIAFFLSKDGRAWYAEGGKKFHLAHAPGGFAWPSNNP
ncbi:DEAD/DEAH box helicase [Micromonospora okii]|uniref:DEAD/DEAH box helicase n=1 Tax=Micromonospora okii TaxID=1182970 RepID=UPI001E4045C8|nr:DEAD/DEAH box helicase [Micromonospora okii]